MDDLNNIWNADDELNEEELLQYLKGTAPEEQSHTVEEQMAYSPFVNDAVEGLQNIADKEKLDAYVSDLNKNLRKQLQTGKQKEEKRKIKNLNWIVASVIIILVLCMVAFAVYFML